MYDQFNIIGPGPSPFMVNDPQELKVLGVLPQVGGLGRLPLCLHIPCLLAGGPVPPLCLCSFPYLVALHFLDGRPALGLGMG